MEGLLTADFLLGDSLGVGLGLGGEDGGWYLTDVYGGDGVGNVLLVSLVLGLGLGLCCCTYAWWQVSLQNQMVVILELVKVTICLIRLVFFYPSVFLPRQIHFWIIFSSCLDRFFSSDCSFKRVLALF